MKPKVINYEEEYCQRCGIIDYEEDYHFCTPCDRELTKLKEDLEQLGITK